MQLDQLTQGIEAKFEHSRIVFWYDPEQSFQEVVASIAITVEKLGSGLSFCCKIKDLTLFGARDLITDNYIVRYLVYSNEVRILRIWHQKESRF